MLSRAVLGAVGGDWESERGACAAGNRLNTAHVPCPAVIGCARTAELEGGDVGEETAELVEFACREPGCTEQVTYHRQVVPGVAYDPASGPKTAYLECPRGHIYPYSLHG
jgi:hypothetical protein